jgi:hypothetical protein
LGFLTKALVRCVAAKNALRAVVVEEVHPLLQFLKKRLASSMTWPSRGAGLVIAEQEGWSRDKVGTLGEHLAGRASR